MLIALFITNVHRKVNVLLNGSGGIEQGVMLVNTNLC